MIVATDRVGRKRWTDELRGPLQGSVGLPARLFWSGPSPYEVRWDLADPIRRRDFYEIVLVEGTLDDVRELINVGELLLPLGPDVPSVVGPVGVATLARSSPHGAEHSKSRISSPMISTGYHLIASSSLSTRHPVPIARSRCLPTEADCMTASRWTSDRCFIPTISQPTRCLPM